MYRVNVAVELSVTDITFVYHKKPEVVKVNPQEDE
jgi:hypothetical protein